MSYSQEHISDLLKKQFDVHGYSFQYSVLRKANDLLSQKHTKWVLEAAEFPVVNKNDSTHIDFILKHRYANLYLIAECKRADPARANWCFVETPYTWRDIHLRKQYVQFDKLIADGWKDPQQINQSPYFQVDLQTTAAHTNESSIVHLGLEVNTGNVGDGIGNTNKSAINSAVSQVSRSCSGYLNHFKRSLLLNPPREKYIYRFIPVIFTTAQLWVTKTDLGQADLKTGNLPADSVDAQPVDWLWFNYNRSTNLASELELNFKAKHNKSKDYYEFLRTIAFVSSSGIENFLRSDMEEWLNNSD